jgi:hypothetical protein
MMGPGCEATCHPPLRAEAKIARKYSFTSTYILMIGGNNFVVNLK